jgi:RimJ/RimL family protein N-acetyltransferase
MDAASVDAIIGWRYEPPYDFYNIPADPEDLEELGDRKEWGRTLFAAFSGDELAGFASIVRNNWLVTLGLALRPDLTGRRLGPAFFGAVLEHARSLHGPSPFRLIVAEFNQRAIKVYARAGFETTKRFMHRTNGGDWPFLEMIRQEACRLCGSPGHRPVPMGAGDVAFVLDAAGAEMWLDGGWGVDALLGSQTREHDDLDIEMGVEDVASMRRRLEQHGFVLTHGVPESNFVLADSHGRHVDVHPVRFDERGDGIYLMDNGEYFTFPASAFSGRGTIAGRPVKCLSARAQLTICHQGYELDENDLADLAALRARFAAQG